MAIYRLKKGVEPSSETSASNLLPTESLISHGPRPEHSVMDTIMTIWVL
jgi:hypothetical protein